MIIDSVKVRVNLNDKDCRNLLCKLRYGTPRQVDFWYNAKCKITNLEI